MRIIQACIFAFCVTAGAIACDTDRTPPTPTQPSDSILYIAVTPDTLGIGGTFRFKATATLANGQTSDVTETANWQSSDSSVIQVRARGFAEALRLGAATITASQQGITVSQQVTTYPCISWGTASTSGSATIWAGESVLWRANGYNACLTHWSGVSPKWQSLNPSVVTVDYRPEWGSPEATLVGRTPGTATIVMTVDGNGAKPKEDRATVTVLNRPPPDALYIHGNEFMSVGDVWQFGAQAEWANPINRNDEVTTAVQWKSSNRSVAIVSPTGNVTCRGAGTVIISAEFEGVRTDVTVQVWTTSTQP